MKQNKANRNALADRLENEELWPDEEDYYLTQLSPQEMALIIASLRRAQTVTELEGAIRDFAKYLPPEVNERARAVLAHGSAGR